MSGLSHGWLSHWGCACWGEGAAQHPAVPSMGPHGMSLKMSWVPRAGVHCPGLRQARAGTLNLTVIQVDFPSVTYPCAHSPWVPFLTAWHQAAPTFILLGLQLAKGWLLRRVYTTLHGCHSSLSLALHTRPLTEPCPDGTKISPAPLISELPEAAPLRGGGRPGSLGERLRGARA